MSDRIGQQFGNYQLTRLLGTGGFADVYLGEHVHLSTQAAMKLLHTQVTNEDGEQFRNEARTIARLLHPNIVRVLDFGVEGKTPFLVMDFAPHGTLRQRHARGDRPPLTTIASYVRQIADALQYAHDEKLIHRDIKPENMLVGRRDEILLGDFGIALVAQSSRYQNTQDVVGTVAYMSPEQIQGKPRPASDQYSLAIVVYEWLCGTRPFRGSFIEICTQHTMAVPPPLRTINASISQDVERVVMTALSKDPHERFATIQVFANALGQAIQESYAPTVFIKPVKPDFFPTVKATSPPKTASSPKKSQAQWLEEGNTHYNAQRYKEAIAAYDEALVLTPKDAPLYNKRGLVYQALQEYEKAIADFDRAISLSPSFVMAYYNRGLAYSNLTEHNRAIADFDIALSFDLSLASAYYSRGNAFAELGQYQQAIADYNNTLSLDPEDVEAYTSRGEVYVLLKDFRRAMKDFDRAVELNGYSKAYAHRGDIYCMLRDFRRAIKDFDRAIAIDSENLHVHGNRAFAYRKLREFQHAVTDYNRIIKLDPKNAVAYGNRGLAYYEMKEYSRAVQDFDHALRLDSTLTWLQSEREAAYNCLTKKR